MNNPLSLPPRPLAPSSIPGRLDHLDAARAFALLLGVVFHAALSFSPFYMGWAVQDVSTSSAVLFFMHVSHSFRMELFFLLAGFFSHGLLKRQGAAAFLRSRAIRLGVPFVAGWFLLRPLLLSGWIMGAASMRGDYDFWAGIRSGFASLQALPAGLFTGSHLWFLYYLLLVTGLALGAWMALRRAAVLPSALDAATGWLVRSRWMLPILILPTACALWGMQHWGMDTPDRSLRPHGPVLAIYAGFFATGCILGRQETCLIAFERVNAWRVFLVLVSATGTYILSGVQADPGHPHYTAARAAFVLGYATMMWTLVMLVLGTFRKIFSQPRPVIRYLADSSYWVYLIHLPIVVWLQVALAEVPVHWSLKLTAIFLATLAVALLTYDLFIRPTRGGLILNGRRRSPVLSTRRRSPNPSMVGRERV